MLAGDRIGKTRRQKIGRCSNRASSGRQHLQPAADWWRG